MSIFFTRSHDGLTAYQPEAGAVVDGLDSIRVEAPDKEKLKAMPRPVLVELAVKFGLPSPTQSQSRDVIASLIVERFEAVKARLERASAPASSSQDAVDDHLMDSITGKQVPMSGERSLVDVVKKEKGFHVGFYEGDTEQFHIYTPFGMYAPEEDLVSFISQNNCVFLSATEGRDEGWLVSSSEEGSDEDEEQSEVEQSEIATTSPEDVAPALEEVATETEKEDEPLVCVKVVGGDFVDGKTYEFQYPLSTIMAKVLDDYAEFIVYAQVPEHMRLYHKGDAVSIGSVLKDKMTKKEMKVGYIEFKCVSSKSQLSETVFVKVYRERVFWQEGKPEYIPIELTVPRQTTTINDIKKMVQDLKGTPIEEFDLYAGLKKCDIYRRLQEYVCEENDINLHAHVKALGGAPSVLKTVLKSKTEKKSVISKVAKDVSDEAVAYTSPYKCQLLDEAKKFLQTIRNIDPTTSDAVFQGAVDALNLEDTQRALSLFDTSNKTTGTTEAKIEEVIKLSMKAKLECLRGRAVVFEQIEQGIIASLVSLYGHFAQGAKTYDNSKLKEMLTTRISNLKRGMKAPAPADDDLAGLTEKFASASI